MNKPNDLSTVLLILICLLLLVGLLVSIYFVAMTSSKIDEKVLQMTSLEETAQALSTQTSLQLSQLDQERNAQATSDAMIDLLSAQLDEQKVQLQEEYHARATAEAVAEEITSLADEGLCAYLLKSLTPTPIYFDIEEPPPKSGEKITFTSYSIPLREESGWKVGSPEGSPATLKEILSVLCNVGSLTIQFEGTVQVFLDNVNLDGTFDSFPECTNGGWGLVGNSLADCNSVLGDPPGSISNGIGAAIFRAPVRYLGDQSAAYGGWLSFTIAAGYGEALQSAENVVLTPASQPDTQ